ncbi:hypothetical protein ACIBQ2_07670 [Micromonospora sediminimaris]|uniref:hypothetical protein n=1 Tax=Micromonospora sediminimaris TaxID=547162 RepID=UPI00378E0056
MSPASFAYQYPSKTRFSGPGRPTGLDPQLLLPADRRLQQLAEVPGDRPGWAQDLVQIARAVYLADKLSSRALSDDGWTRHIELSVEVVEPDRWTERTLVLLSRLLEALSSDHWAINVRPGAVRWPHQGRMLSAQQVQEVALFSGGLDSTAHAVERSTAGAGDLLLVSYYEPHWGRQQDVALATIRTAASRGIQQFKASQQVRAPNVELEKSARTRGLLYVATAVYLAAVHDVPHIAVPENGQLALNPALTPARAAACSTRSVHPGTLSLLNEIIGTVGGTATVINPYLHLTKGEVCQRALRAGLEGATLTNATVSCGRPPRDRPDPHCGCCYPCLVRHSGLLTALGDDDTPYVKDVWAMADRLAATDDRRALQRWLSEPFGVRDLFTDLPVPEGSDLTALVDVVQRGRTELTRMFVRHHKLVRAAIR